MPSFPTHPLVEAERSVASKLHHRIHTLPPHPKSVHDAGLSFGQRLADRVAEIAGSWSFIGVFAGVLALWMFVNVHAGTGAFDPYPFILLNLVLSTVAALQAPVIMMSQNRAAARDRVQADLDYRVNVQAEAEIAQLRAEMDELRRQQLAALFAIQEEQLSLLRHIATSGETGAAPRDP